MHDIYDNDFDKAFDEAVDAIERNVKKKHGRLIDADKLKKHYSWWQGGTLAKTLDEMKRDFDTIIDLQPTVEAEPIEVRAAYEQKAYNKGYADGIADSVKHGHWIVLHGVLAGDDIYGDMGECSNCGLHLRNWEWNFCPCCGAKMDEVEE